MAVINDEYPNRLTNGDLVHRRCVGVLMALQAQIIPVVFSGGQNNKVDDKNAPVPTLGLIQNAVLNKQFKFQKRYGRTDKAAGTTYVNARAIISAKDDVYVADDSNFSNVLTPTALQKKFGPVGYSVQTQSLINGVKPDSFLGKNTACATTGNYILTAGFYGPDLIAVVKTIDTDEFVGQSTIASPLTNAIKVFANGGNFYIGTESGGTLDIYQIAPTLITSSLVITLTVVTGLWDIANDSTSWYVAYSTAAPAIIVKKYTGTTNDSTITYAATTAYQYVTINTYEGAAKIAVASADAAAPTLNVVVFRINRTAFTTDTQFTIASGAGGTSVEYAHIYPQTSGVAMSAVLQYYFTTASGSKAHNTEVATIPTTTLVTVQTLSNVIIASKPINDPYSTVLAIGWLGMTAFVDSLTVEHDPTYVWQYYDPATALVHQVARFAVNKGFVCGAAFTGLNRSSTPSLITKNLFSQGTSPTSSFIIVGCSITSSLQSSAGVINRYYSGACAYINPRSRTTQTQFLTESVVVSGLPATVNKNTVIRGPSSKPIIDTVTTTAGAGIAAGTYNYKAVLEERDSEGNVYRSHTSNVGTITIGGAVAALRPRMVNPQSSSYAVSTFMEYYRTTNGGTIYYLAGTGGIGTIFSDTTTDATLVLNEVLYTTGGVLDNEPAPSLSYAVTRNNQVYGLSSETPDVIYISKPFVQGLGIEWSSVLYTTLNTGFGTANSLAVLDDKLIIFKDDSCYFQVGNGGDATGENATLSEPQLISATIGVRFPRSVISTQVGVFFMSNSGFYLLTRGMELQYIGAAVEDYNSVTEVTGATYIPSNREIRFSTSASSCLVYNMFFNLWYVFTNYSCAHSAFYSGKFLSFNTANTKLLYEDSTVYADDSTNYVMKVMSNWINFGGMGTFQRLRRMFVTMTSYVTAALTLKFYTDFSSSPNTLSYTPTIGDNDFNVGLPVQKCGSFKFSIEDSGSVGNSFDLSGVSVEAGLKAGTNKLPNTKST